MSSVLTAAVVVTLFAASVAAHDTTGVGSISGVVVNAAGQPAIFASGTVSPLDAELIQDVTFLTGGHSPRRSLDARDVDGYASN